MTMRWRPRPRVPVWAEEILHRLDRIDKRLATLSEERDTIMSALSDLQNAAAANTAAGTDLAAAVQDAITMMNTLADTSAIVTIATTLQASTDTLTTTAASIRAAVAAVTPPST